VFTDLTSKEGLISTTYRGLIQLNEKPQTTTDNVIDTYIRGPNKRASKDPKEPYRRSIDCENTSSRKYNSKPQ
jgi:hypothetical protein